MSSDLTKQCQNCIALQAQLDELLDLIQQFPPHQTDPYKAKCLKCGQLLYEIEHHGSSHVLRAYYRRTSADDKWCNGMGWFKKSCPKIEHMHRKCTFCGAKWIERCIK